MVKIARSNDHCSSTGGMGSTVRVRCKVRIIFIIEDPLVTAKWWIPKIQRYSSLLGGGGVVSWKCKITPVLFIYIIHIRSREGNIPIVKIILCYYLFQRRCFYILTLS